MEPRNSLNAAQKLHLLAHSEHADKLLTEIESILVASESKSAFPKYKPDLSVSQVQMVRQYIARIRAQMLRALKSQDVEPPEARFGSVHSIRVTLAFAAIAFEECSAKGMRGYGEVADSLKAEVDGLVEEMKGLINRLDSYLAQGLGQNLEARLEKLREAGDVRLVKALGRLIERHGLVEFRPTLEHIIDRLERPRYEIAFFGRVSSGKSSLLNRLLEQDILPVGVTPVTAVTTHVVFGPVARATASFADRAAESFELSRLAEFATEQNNPGNSKLVSRIVVEIPSPYLRVGLVYVDTPGLGSLATKGAAETVAYLPRSDLGIVLVDAASTLTEGDLSTIRALYDAGVPAMVLLSKADLLAPDDRNRARQYVAEQITSELGIVLPVYPVSAKPDHAELLQAWLRDEILPLHARHAELSRESLARKIGVLRAAVTAALCSKTKHLQRCDAGRLRALETEVRIHSGRFSAVLYACLEVAGEIRASGDSALKAAAAAMARAQNNGNREPDLLTLVIAQSCAEKARPIVTMLNELAHDSADLLARAASGLDSGNAPDANEFFDLLKELPHLEINLDSTICPDSITSLRGTSLLGKSWATRRLERRLRSQIEGRVVAAFSSYGKQLESWIRHTTHAMQSRFDAYASVFRAELNPLEDNLTMDPQEAEQIERDLREIAGV